MDRWEDMVVVGRIARPHGLRGDVLIAPVVRLSSAAALVKLACLAAASKAAIERKDGGRTGTACVV